MPGKQKEHSVCAHNFMALRSNTRQSGLSAWWCLQPQNERCQLIKAHMSSGEITGEHFQSVTFGQKCSTFSNSVAQLSVPNSQLVAYSGNIYVWVVSYNECGGLTVRARLSQHEESHGSHGMFYEGEQEQCRSIPAGALHGGLRISQWHKLCWSCAGITLAGTTGQLSLSRIVSGPTSNPYLLPAPAYLQ